MQGVQDVFLVEGGEHGVAGYFNLRRSDGISWHKVGEQDVFLETAGEGCVARLHDLWRQMQFTGVRGQVWSQVAQYNSDADAVGYLQDAVLTTLRHGELCIASINVR